jgi:phosphoribosylglycinamide formyltransferase 2
LFGNLDRALAEPDTALMLFGKPAIAGRRRMGVALALGRDIDDAKRKAEQAADAVTVQF